MKSSLPARFWAKTEQAGDHILWVAAQNSRGYGCYGVDGVSQLAHRVAWEDAHGPIPDGLTIDHLCRIKCCVNVAHMELVTRTENQRRASFLKPGGECSNGHPIATEADLYVNPRGRAECRACRRNASARDKATRQAAAS